MCSSNIGRIGPATFGTRSPNSIGSEKPDEVLISFHNSSGRGVLKRSYWRSDRTTMSPTFIN